MGIAAAIISGVIGTAAAVTSAVGASQAAEAQEEAEAKRLKLTEEEAEKERKLKMRQQNLQSFETLAGQRMQAEQTASRRSFNKTAKAGLQLALQRRQNKARQAPQMMQQGNLPTTTFGRAA